MDSKELRGLYEAYSEVYAPQEIDEAVKGASRHDTEMRKAAASERKAGVKNRLAPSEGKANAAKMHRDIKFYDKITKKTKPSVVGMTHEEVEQIDEVSYSAKAARAGKDIGKPGKAFEKIAASAAKRYGSKERGKKVAGAVLAKLRKEDTDIFDVVLEFLQAEGFAETLEEAEWMMANVIDEEAIGIILGEGYQRNPEKGEEKDRKYEPVRGEKTPMPPRGNKKREDFEKWYAANVR